ncbi:MAG: cytidylyltransferase [Pelagibacteraceae bacterium]|nr:cytidylyltransferase [Pelagibacteraceae bacterium]|tara:strand:+ start:3443 stop:4186 length:744 start_codon:yes stop_codon:yes gene_type:complete
MILAIMIGRSGSKGFKNKNIKKVFGKHLCEYPLIAAKKSKLINKIYVSTNCNIIKKISKNHKVKIINRPKKLTTDKVLGEKVFQHAYFEAKKDLGLNSKEIEFVVLLFANAATLTSEMINNGIKILRNDKSFDSAVSTSIYNMWSPIRARKLDKKTGCLKPFVPFKTFGNVKKLNCDRGSQGDVYYADMSVSVVRPYCLENMTNNLLPQKWMGKKIAPIFSVGGFDLDYDWQMPSLKFWLKNYAKKN